MEYQPSHDTAAMLRALRQRAGQEAGPRRLVVVGEGIHAVQALVRPSWRRPCQAGQEEVGPLEGGPMAEAA